MKKKQYVKDLKMGDRVESQFLVTGKRYLNFKRASGKYLALTLADRTGEIQAKVWDQAEAKGRGFRSGRVAHVTGEVVIFNEVLEIHVTDITETQDYQNDDFVVIDELRISELAAELRDIVALLDRAPVNGWLSYSCSPNGLHHIVTHRPHKPYTTITLAGCWNTHWG